jgi:hypothetical protein
VTNGIPLGCPLPLNVTTVNSIQTLKVQIFVLSDLVIPMPADAKSCVIKLNNPDHAVTVIGKRIDNRSSTASGKKGRFQLLFQSASAVDQFEIGGLDVSFENISFVIEYKLSPSSAEEKDQFFDCEDGAIFASAKTLKFESCSFESRSTNDHAKVLLLNISAPKKKCCKAVFKKCEFGPAEQAFRAGTFLYGNEEEVKKLAGRVSVEFDQSHFTNIGDMAVQVNFNADLYGARFRT